MNNQSLLARFVTIVLSFCLLFTTIDALERAQPAQAQAAAGVLIIACAAIASCIIIRVMRQPPDVVDRVLVLYRDHYDDNWTAVVTNFHAILYADHPVSVFADQYTGDVASRYRVKDITEEWRKLHPLFADRPQGVQKANGGWTVEPGL